MVKIDADFTTQLLYAGIKTGLTVSFNDMGLNVVLDLLHYAAEVDNAVMQGASGKNVRKRKPMNLAELTKAGRTKA